MSTGSSFPVYTVKLEFETQTLVAEAINVPVVYYELYKLSNQSQLALFQALN